MENLKVVNFSVTMACNMHCSFCWQHKLREKTLLDFDKFIRVLDDAKGYGVNNIYFWGGEPLIHPRIFDMIGEVKKRRMKSYMVTNGLLLEKYADKIVNSGLNFLQISIDGAAEQHDKMRNVAGLFEKITKGIEKINKQKRIFPIISSCTTIMKENIEQICEIADKNLGIGIDVWFYQFLMTFSQDTINRYKKRLVDEFSVNYDSIKSIDYFCGKEMSREEYKRAGEMLRKLKKKYKDRVSFPEILSESENYKYYKEELALDLKQKKHICRSINERMNVQPNGDVVMCPDFPDLILGNVFEQSIKSIWASEKRLKFRDDFYNGKPFSICHRCCQLWEQDGNSGILR